MKRTTNILLCLLVFPMVLFAQQGEWDARNNGLNDQEVYSLFANPDNSDIIYAATEGGLYFSENNGGNWSLLYDDLPVRDVWVSDDGETILITASGGSRSDGLWMSQNGGQNFQVWTWILWPTSIAVNPENENQVFVGTINSGVLWTDNGNDWQDGNQNMGDVQVNHIQVVNVDEDTFAFLSSPAGLYVTEVFQGEDLNWEETAPHGLPVSQTAFSWEEIETIYTGTDDESDSDGFFVSDNMGDGWDVLYYCHHVSAVETYPDLLMFASGEVGVQISHNEGEDWTTLNDGLPDAIVSDILITGDENDPTFIISTLSRGVYRFVPADGDPPSAFALVEPDDGDEVDGREINFLWEESFPPEGDSLFYEMRFDWDNDQVIWQAWDNRYTYFADSGNVQLPEDTEILWRVTAIAGDSETECDEPFTFTITGPGNNEPPSEFNLLRPNDGVRVEPGIIDFAWEASVDPDDNPVLYEFQLTYVGSQYTTNVRQNGLCFDADSIGFRIPEGTECTWWVTAESADDRVECNRRFRFVYGGEDNPPANFALLTPVDEAIIQDRVIEFTWEASEDPDGDEVSYNWSLEFDGNLINQRIDLTSFVFDPDGVEIELPVNTPIIWYVTAYSGVFSVECEERFWFSVFSDDQPPSLFELLEPAHESEVYTEDVTFSWQESVDPDEDAVVYDLWVSDGHTTVNFENLQQTTLIVTRDQLSDIGNFRMGFVWCVTAISNNLRTECADRFSFTLMPLSVSGDGTGVVNNFSLNAAYPNPFNSTTRIDFSLPAQMNIQLAMYNMQGELVQEIASGELAQGAHSASWSPESLPAGIYLARLVGASHSATMKLVYLK